MRLPLAASIEPRQLAERLVCGPGDVWLDDSETERHLLACDPLVQLRARGRETEVRVGRRELTLFEDLFVVLEALVLGLGSEFPRLRLFGYLGYELGDLLERIPAAPPRSPDVPDAWLGLHAAWIESAPHGWDLVASAAWCDRGRLQRLCANLACRAREPAPKAVPAAAGPWRVQPDDAEFECAVRRTVERIVAGEIFQTNLCRIFEAPFAAAGRRDLHRRLRAANPARYGAYVELDEGAVVSMSPECFLRCRDGKVESEPIKGTRARTGVPAADAAAAEDLCRSDKDRAELAMIVDLVRNDLGRVCVPGSVHVLEHARLLTLPTVLHTFSRVAGRVRADASWVDLIRAAFPAGSITGAPKIAAIAVAREHECCARGPAMGAVGWIALGGDLELSVAIRTAVVAGRRIVYHAGCGVVAGSDPVSERLETDAKARVLLEVFE